MHRTAEKRIWGATKNSVFYEPEGGTAPPYIGDSSGSSWGRKIAGQKQSPPIDRARSKPGARPSGPEKIPCRAEKNAHK